MASEIFEIKLSRAGIRGGYLKFDMCMHLPWGQMRTTHLQLDEHYAPNRNLVSWRGIRKELRESLCKAASIHSRGDDNRVAWLKARKLWVDPA